MKSLIIIALLVFPAAAVAQKAKSAAQKKKFVATKPAKASVGSVREKFDPKRNPDTDIAAAITKAQKEGKRIILDVGGEWCGWCIEMDEYFAKNPALLKIRDRSFVWVKVNMSPENENTAFLSRYPKIQGYPHLFVLESDGSFLGSQDTSDLEEPTPEPVVVKRDSSGKPVLVDLGSASYDLYKMVDFLKKWSQPN